jgi:hypothetical protein
MNDETEVSDIDPKSCYTFECSPVAMHYRFYDTGYHKDNYRAQFFAFQAGEGVMVVKGLMDKSNGFYRNFAHLLPDVMKSFGAHTMIAEAMPTHAKLMQKFLKDGATVTIQKLDTTGNKDLCSVTIVLNEELR